jgi:hypothetical protein
MKWMPTSLGAEPKKVAILGVLLAVLGVVYWMNSGPAPPPVPAAKSAPRAAQTAAPQTAATRPPAVRPRPVGRTSDDFTPTLKVPEGFDLASVDPNLKLDLLAKVRAVGEAGGRRSLFEFYTPPPPPPPKVKPITPAEAPKPLVAKPADPPKPVKPAPPPLTFKFFGYEGRPGDRSRHAMFVDGEDSYVLAEGDMVRDRYKVIRIGVTSVEIEDTVSKDRQTLQIVPPADQ